MKRVLMIAPYKDIFPPKNGGMLRCFHILSQLSLYFDVTLISYGEKFDIYKTSKLYTQLYKIKVLLVPYYFDNITNIFTKKLFSISYKLFTLNPSVKLSSDFYNFYFFLKNYKNICEFDVVIVENLVLFQLAKVLRKKFPNATLYYDSHNVDSDLAKIDFKRGKISKKDYRNILNQESKLFKFYDKIWACSQVDANRLSVLNKEKITIDVIPNGSEIREVSLKNKKIKKYNILFCGTLDYEPNKEGLIWFLTKVWPLVLEKSVEIVLTVIGKGVVSQDLLSMLTRANVNFKGEVEDVLPFYMETDIVIVPLFSGSGTRLKVLEAMANDRPIVSTSKGAEGINYIRNTHILIEESPESFAEGIFNLLNDDDLFNKISVNAKSLIEEYYSWDIIGKNIQKSINNGN